MWPGAGALVRYLPPYSPNFDKIAGSYCQAKYFIRENGIVFRCRHKRHAFILHTLRKFHQKTAKGISETLAISEDSSEVIILNPFITYIGVS